ncbi:MAG: hypothetical protein Q8O34_07085 [Rhodocyclaceae bacterium]|nr:hypothetical protein [Rhodocyclaceae bacterium]
MQISSTSFAQISTISSALASRFLASTSGPAPRADAGGVKGMAAGSGKSPWNVWASVGNNNTRISYFANTATRENESDLLNTVLGGDYALSSNMAVGVSVAFDRGSGVGKAAGVVQNSFSSEGYMIAPYLGMQLSKEMAVDISAGFGSGEMTSGSTTTTTSEADRMFYAANLSYNQWMGNVQLLGKLGYLHGEEDYGNSKTNGVANNFTAAENKVDQLRAGVQAGYWMNGVMPYAGLAYSSDVNRSTTQMNAPGNPVGRDAFVWTLGVNFFSLSSGVTGGIAYNQEESRTNQKNNSLMANINLRF